MQYLNSYCDPVLFCFVLLGYSFPEHFTPDMKSVILGCENVKYTGYFQRKRELGTPDSGLSPHIVWTIDESVQRCIEVPSASMD